ncbi:high affinity immunoglobulin epsilon receptor subunit gamma [Misgurnus anguillicaudatus]|uniref:high affinity immunoglobulin epsilon receptor subunit gamma n=1 Tax=Misgurnus anguillicaudatus TaxID=75329 RepID=UPI002435CF83|nr:high affinity immunoglobulin epsilon receptor subunit gamma [Misgurnus anguillicaudatus]
MIRATFPFSLLSLWLSFSSAEANLKEPQICYVLDAVLFIYGIVLTILYCRLKLRNKEAVKKSPRNKDAGEGVYEGLKPHDQDTYETLGTKK